MLTLAFLLQIIYIDAKHFRLNMDTSDHYWGIGDEAKRLEYGGPKERDSVVGNAYNRVRNQQSIRVGHDNTALQQNTAQLHVYA